MEQKNIEAQVAESVMDAFTVIFGGITDDEQRNLLLAEIESVDINGEPIGRILLGIVVAVAALQESLTGQTMSLSEVSEAMNMVAASFEKHLAKGE